MKFTLPIVVLALILNVELIVAEHAFCGHGGGYFFGNSYFRKHIVTRLIL